MTDESLVGLHLRSVFCVSLVGTKRDIFGGVLIFSAFVGLVGSVFQLFLWKKYLKKHETRHKPSSNPVVVFHLALASAIAALSKYSTVFYLFGIGDPDKPKGNEKVDCRVVYPREILCNLYTWM